MTPESMLTLTYDEAQTVGQALHDHWTKMIGATPMERDSMGWADLVQFVARKARERVAEREADA